MMEGYKKDGWTEDGLKGRRNEIKDGCRKY